MSADLHKHGARTVPEALAAAAQRWPERGVHLYDEGGVKSLSFAQLLERAERAGLLLRGRGLEPGARVMIVAPTSMDTITALLGAMHAGIVPVPVPPLRQSRTANVSRYLGSLGRLAERLRCPAMVTPPGDTDPLLARAQVELGLEWVAPVTAFTGAAAVEGALGAGTGDPEGIAYIQMSSGSTGPPKSVLLTHRSILSNVRAIGAHLAIGEEDVGVSWLPLHNDMGLVGTLFFAIVWGVPLVLLNPDRYLRSPHEWLWAIANHAGTLSPAPDFGFHYCTRRAKKSDLEGLDLSSWRVAMSGSEPVVPAHIRAFERRFRPYGLRPNAFIPVYGLAEATLAVTFAPLGAPIRIDRVARDALETEGQALPSQDEAALEFVSVGTALPGLAVEIRDHAGHLLPERTVGEIHVSGHSVMHSFIGAEPGAQEVRCEGWVATADLGYLADGDLFVTGRRADAIRLGERTLFPEELEHLIGRIEGVRPGSVAVFGVPHDAAARNRNPRIRQVAQRATQEPTAALGPTAPPMRDDPEAELLIVAVEVSDGLDHEEMKGSILEVVHKHLALLPHDVRILSPGSVPKTSSGKVRRFLCKQLYLDEALDRRERQERWQAVTQFTDRARNFVAQFGRRIRTFFDNS